MKIGNKLRQIREQKGLSQGDIEERSGLLRCYTSRVENGHTVPSLETLHRFAHALEIEVYKFFYDENSAPPPLQNLMLGPTIEELAEPQNGHNGSEEQLYLRKIRAACRRLSLADKNILLVLARKMVEVHPVP